MRTLGFLIISSLIFLFSFKSLLAFKTQKVVDLSILNLFNIKDNVDIIVTLKTGITNALAKFQNKSFDNKPEFRIEKLETLRSALISNAEESQNEIKSLLNAKGFSYQSFWITNKIIIHNADFELVEQLSMHSSIEHIRKPVISKIPQTATDYSQTLNSELQWGVSKVGAPQFWNSGHRGQGIVVGIIDTGVRGSHEILKENYVGQNGWFDPYELTRTVNDSDGHGTHCIGTIAGKAGYGVAPEAKWMACKGCYKGNCYEQGTLACGQFMLCPTDPAGENPNCSLAPNVVSNSWGGPGGQDFYDDVIRVWHASGIIPIFSAGNKGSNCGTIGSPGDRDVISVGATDMNDILAPFSSRGPTQFGRIKPDIVAPGVQIKSAGHLSDNAFAVMSGTSMAAPHLAGTVALLLSQNKQLTYAQVKDVLFKSAVKTNLRTNFIESCGDIPQNVFPNNFFGNGRSDLAGINAIVPLNPVYVRLHFFQQQVTVVQTAPTEKKDAKFIDSHSCFLIFSCFFILILLAIIKIYMRQKFEIVLERGHVDEKIIGNDLIKI